MSPGEQAAWDKLLAINDTVKTILEDGAEPGEPHLSAAVDQALAALRDYALAACLDVPGVTS